MVKRKGRVVDGMRERLHARAVDAEAEVDDAAQEQARRATLIEVPLSAVAPNPANVRSTFDERAIDELAESLKAAGLLQPMLVRPATAEERVGSQEIRYTILAGERRWRAAKRAGLEVVPAVVRVDHDLAADTAVMLIENLQREDLSAVEEARAFQRLTEAGLSQRAVASEVGVTQAHVSRRLALLSLLPVLQKMVQVGDLGVDVAAKDLARLPTEEQQLVIDAMSERGGKTSWGDPEHVRAAVASVQAQLARAATEERLRSRIVPGAEEMSHDDLFSLHRRWDRELDDDDEITAAAEEQRLGVVVDTGTNRLLYLNTGPLPKSDPSPVDQAERDRVQRYRQNGDAIARWVAAHHRQVPKATALTTSLAAYTVATASAEEIRVVHRWVQDHYGDPEADNEGLWRQSLQPGDLPAIAWLVTVAHDLALTRYGAEGDAVGRTAARVAEIEQEEQR